MLFSLTNLLYGNTCLWCSRTQQVNMNAKATAASVKFLMKVGKKIHLDLSSNNWQLFSSEFFSTKDASGSHRKKTLLCLSLCLLSHLFKL